MNIGLTYTGTAEKHQYYVNWLKQGENLNIITLSAETKENKGNIADCDGLVLSGGIDIHPGYYNNDNVVYPNMPQQFYQKRDAFEIGVYAAARKKNIPILGVCRGMQLINCVEGGNLQQDLASKNTIHKAVTDDHKKQFDKAHGLHIVPGTLLAAAAGMARSVVNSAHHQCADTIAGTLMVNCLSDDNVVEGLEWKDKAGKPFLLCIQWHPERMFAFQLAEAALAAGLRNQFVDAIKKTKS